MQRLLCLFAPGRGPLYTSQSLFYPCKANTAPTPRRPNMAITIGYIGLGNAGMSMSSNLPKNGYDLIVHDIDEEKVQRALQWPNTRTGNFRDCDIIITMLTHRGIVRQALEPLDLKEGTIIVDISSSSPFDTLALAKDLTKRGLKYIDSPIIHACHGSTLMVIRRTSSWSSQSSTAMHGDLHLLHGSTRVGTRHEDPQQLYPHYRIR